MKECFIDLEYQNGDPVDDLTLSEGEIALLADIFFPIIQERVAQSDPT